MTGEYGSRSHRLYTPFTRAWTHHDSNHNKSESQASGKIVCFLFEWRFTPLSTVFKSYHGDSSHYLCLSWVSPVLGWGSEVSCPRILPAENRLSYRTQTFERNIKPLARKCESMTFVESVDRDQTPQRCSLILDLHCRVR